MKYIIDLIVSDEPVVRVFQVMVFVIAPLFGFFTWGLIKNGDKADREARH